MSPEEYCRNKAAPAGSNLYYAGLYHPLQQRRKLHALFALLHELNEVVYRASDPGAARVTLYWWLEEIGRLFSGGARHPVTRELSALEHADYLSQQALLGCVATLSRLLDMPESGPYRDWLARHEASAGYIWQAAGRACGDTNQDRLTALARAGACHGAFELLHHSRGLAGLGLNVFPSDLLAARHLTLETIVGADAGAHPQEFFNTLFQQLHDDLRDCRNALQQTAPRPPLFSLTLLEILCILCHKYQRARPPVTHEHLALTPLRKLWIAWRVR
ncbi:MAG: squalene/phytoene synthase family protein [Gammaproteobacteria bacterium]|nr:squalene/phytoene synthase family protein [Gammaproteobacteria bacterium]